MGYDKQGSIFQDKIRLSVGIVQMEFDMIREYQDIVRRIRVDELDEESLSDDPNYNMVWQMVGVLYKFLENKYALLLKKTNKKDYELLVKSMADYEGGFEVSYPQAAHCINQIVKIMSLANFDDVLQKGEEEDDFD